MTNTWILYETGHNWVAILYFFLYLGLLLLLSIITHLVLYLYSSLLGLLCELRCWWIEPFKFGEETEKNPRKATFAASPKKKRSSWAEHRDYEIWQNALLNFYGLGRRHSVLKSTKMSHLNFPLAKIGLLFIYIWKKFNFAKWDFFVFLNYCNGLTSFNIFKGRIKNSNNRHQRKTTWP